MKSILFTASAVIITLALTAFTFSNWNGEAIHEHGCQVAIEIEPPTFFYDLSSGSNNTVTKEQMHNATTLSDLIPEYTIQEDLKNNKLTLRDVKVKIEVESVQHIENGIGNDLSKEQMALLRSTDYSSTFFLEGFIVPKNGKLDVSKERYFNYNMCVVPEQQASYKAGNNAFLDFLKTECHVTIAQVQKGDLKSGSIGFTVTKAGTISNIDMNSSCGYPSVDERMLELMNELPEGWNVATNSKGEKVDQTLVFSYGQGGC